VATPLLLAQQLRAEARRAVHTARPLEQASTLKRSSRKASLQTAEHVQREPAVQAVPPPPLSNTHDAAHPLSINDAADITTAAVEASAAIVYLPRGGGTTDGAGAWPPPVDASMSAAEASRVIFITLARTMRAHEAGVRAADVEALHQYRVAVRRTRSALSGELF